MIKILSATAMLLLFSLFTMQVKAQVGKVGINTSSPQAMLHVKDSSVLFTGDTSINPGNPPVSGAGVRLMWYPDKAAFRAGQVDFTQWNKDNAGYFSIGFGNNTTASGVTSTALGSSTIASGFASIVMGSRSTASGEISTAMGNFTSATGSNSTAMGNSTNASNTNSTAMGSATDATGFHSTAMGNSTHASGDASTAMGRNTTASGINSIAMGFATDASGNNSTAMGDNTTASGTNSTAMGISTTASGNSSTAMGAITTASGFSSTAMGNNTDASGGSSTAMGNSTDASGDNSTAMGTNTTSRAFGSLSIGRNNDSIISSSRFIWVDTDPVFIIGNGTAATSRRNAFIVAKNGETGINVANGMPLAMLHIKARQISDNRHIRLEDDNTTSSANIFYTSDLVFKNNLAGGDFIFRNDANATIFSLFSSGNVTIAGTLTQNSDKRLKKNIQPLQGSLQKILMLGGYHYNWKENHRDQHVQTGLLAQQVEQQMPELVETNSAGIKSVNYSGMIPYTIEAIKELKKENEELRSELIQLKQLVKKLIEENK